MDSLLIGLLAAVAGALVAAAVLRRRDSGAPEAIGAQLTHMQSQLDRALGLARLSWIVVCWSVNVLVSVRFWVSGVYYP